MSGEDYKGLVLGFRKAVSDLDAAIKAAGETKPRPQKPELERVDALADLRFELGQRDFSLIAGGGTHGNRFSASSDLYGVEKFAASPEMLLHRIDVYLADRALLKVPPPRQVVRVRAGSQPAAAPEPKKPAAKAAPRAGGDDDLVAA